MRILQVCYSYPPSFSGYGYQLKTINNYILKKDPTVNLIIITAYDNKYHKKNINDRLEINGMFKNPRILYKKYEKIIVKFFPIIGIIKKFKEILNCDVVHIIKGGSEAAIFILFCRLLKKPTIVKIVQDEIPEKVDDYNKLSLNYIKNKVIIKYADTIISISNEIKTNLLNNKCNTNKILNINNSIDTNRFSPITEKRITEIKEFEHLVQFDKIFTFIGSITKRKGIVDLLTSLKKVKLSYPICILLIGPNYKEIIDFNQQVSQINNQNNNITIKYMSFTKNPEYYIRLSDFLILPSYSEGMPNVVLESLSCEVPVILSDISVHKDLYNENYVKIFELGNIEKLVELFEEIVNNQITLKETKYLARKYVIENHEIDKIGLQYLNLYKSKIK